MPRTCARSCDDLRSRVGAKLLLKFTDQLIKCVHRRHGCSQTAVGQSREVIEFDGTRQLHPRSLERRIVRSWPQPDVDQRLDLDATTAQSTSAELG